MTGLVQGKVAIVTGGAKGLGFGISRCLARDGANILVTGRDGAAAETVATQITEEFGVRAAGMSADMGVKEDVEAMIDRAVAEFGGLDILVNNASLLSPNVLLEQKTDEMLTMSGSTSPKRSQSGSRVSTNRSRNARCSGSASATGRSSVKSGPSRFR